MSTTALDLGERTLPADYFSKIPAELICKILTFCDIQDILSVRGCSRLLSDLSRERGVWLSHLMFLTSAVSLDTQASFPVSLLTTLQVEKVSTAHIRFRKLLQQCSEGTIPFKSMRTVPCIDFSGIRSPAIQLLPGGRHLLKAAPSLELWDLAIEKSIKPTLIASSPLEASAGPLHEFHTFLIPVVRVRGKKCGFILAHYGRLVNGKADIYEIEPSAPNPEFCHIGRLTLPFLNESDKLVYNMSIGKVAIYQNVAHHLEEFIPLVIHVFDCRTKVTLRIRLVSIGESGVSEEVESGPFKIELLEDPEVVVVWNDYNVYVLELPDFFAISGIENHPNPYEITLTSTSSFIWDSRDEGFEGYRFVSFFTKDPAFFQPSPFTFHLIHSNENSSSWTRAITQQLSLDPPWHYGGPKLATVHQAPFHSLAFTLVSTNILHSFTSPDKYRLVWWDEREVRKALHIHVSSIGESSLGEDGELRTDCSRHLLDLGSPTDFEMDWSNYSLSPILGRLAVLDRPSGCILICDYVE